MSLDSLNRGAVPLMTLGSAFPVPEFLYAGNVPHVAAFFAGFILSLVVRCANICTLEETSFSILELSPTCVEDYEGGISFNRCF